VQSGESPLASDKTLNRLFEDASALLAEKGRIVQKVDKSSREDKKPFGAQPKIKEERSSDQITQRVQKPGSRKRSFRWVRSLFGS
jgi:hypothetical protein